MNGIDRMFAPGPLPPWLAAGIGAEPEPLPGAAADGRGIADVERLVSLASYARDNRRQRILVVTTGPIRARGTRPLFGFAHARRRVAVVSTAGLTVDGDPSRWAARVQNVVAHETGHLDGLGHCRTPGCIMQPALTPGDVDARSLAPCGRCPHTGAARVAVVALAFATVCMLAFAGLDRVAVWLKPAPVRPFDCREIAGTAGLHLHFNGTPVVEEPGGEGRSAPLPCRSREVADVLNRTFQQIDPVGFQVVPAAGGGVQVRHAGGVLLEVGARAGEQASPAARASGWVGPVRRLLVAKGRAGENCPDCHLRRAEETRAAWRFMRGITP